MSALTSYGGYSYTDTSVLSDCRDHSYTERLQGLGVLLLIGRVCS